MELMFLGLGRQNRAVAAAESSAQQAKRSAEQLESVLSHLEERFERLSMVTMALWELVKAHNGLTDEQLQQMVADIEARQQQQDTEQSHVCPQCGRSMLVKARRCLYCDYRTPETTAFDSIGR